MAQKATAVVYIITKLELGGAQKVCLELFNNQEKLDVATYLITGKKGILANHVAGKENVFMLSNLKWAASFRGIVREIKVFREIMAIIKGLKKKHTKIIIHTHSTKAGMLGRWAAFFAGISHVVHTVHGLGFNMYQSWLKRALIKSLEWLTLKVTSKLVFVSEKDLITTSAISKTFKKKGCIIRAAVDKKHFYLPAKIFDDHKKTFVIGSISCFKPPKNLFDLLRAFRLLQKNTAYDVRLEIIGDGVLRPSIEAFIKEHKLGDKISLLGWQDDVAPFLKRWDLYAMTSLWEGLPCAIVEALFARLPVVCYDTGGIYEVIKHGENGYLVGHNQLHQFVYYIEKLLYDHALRREFIKNSSNYLDDFTLEAMLAKHKQLYKELS